MTDTTSNILEQVYSFFTCCCPYYNDVRANSATLSAEEFIALKEHNKREDLNIEKMMNNLSSNDRDLVNGMFTSDSSDSEGPTKHKSNNK